MPLRGFQTTAESGFFIPLTVILFKVVILTSHRNIWEGKLCIDTGTLLLNPSYPK